ncbi:MAG: DUF6338 family protein [Terracidiphilus sp.]|jgi:hypothetical protein
MPATLLALQVFLILLPGFSAAYVVQALATRRSQSDFERVVEALVFSFIIYVCYIPLNGGRLPFHIEHDPTGKIDDTVLWEPAQLAWLAAVTAAFALLAVAYIRFDGNRLFRWVRLTERTTRNSIWNDIFEREAINDQPVQVELADGRNVLGVLLYYSDASEDGSLYLTQASWVDANGQTVPIPGPGILLTKNSGIRCVSLLNPATDVSAETAQPAETE